MPQSVMPMMDDLVIQNDEDDEHMEMFMFSQNRISDLPDYEELPEGNWYCSQCTCRNCGYLVDDKEALQSPGALKCTQCEHKYHDACLKDHTYLEVASDTLFCGKSCQEVYSGLQSRIRIVNLPSGGCCWNLLRCFHGDQRGFYFAQRLSSPGNVSVLHEFLKR
ncbi:Increased DNA methylation 1 [Camellia lanceoleosa]|uniref:Increased DNA methylation 1 n=1 Tax=Camellia lanceoleosa TaxID=1840588 RepID=A0ACC0I6T3_9ERIC|nr:Increased DNA methylation 1 [Camellia lanceoleosa]